MISFSPGVPGCPDCGGRGWRFVDGPRSAGSTVDRCECTNGAQRSETLIRLSNLPPKFQQCSLKTFKTQTPEQYNAKVALGRWIKDYSSESRGLLFDGPPGVGKSHLAAAAIRGLAEIGVQSRYWNVPQLFMELRATFSESQATNELELIDRCVNVPMLVLDDLGAERPTDYVRERWYLIIQRRYEQMKPVIVTANLNDEQIIAHAGQRILSRLKEMTIHIEVDATDYRYRHTTLPTQQEAFR